MTTTATTATHPTYQPTAIAPDALEGLRERDDAGAAPRPYADDEGGAPLRCCLRRSRAGERIALVSYAPLRRWAARTGAAPGAYDEVGPVFVHADVCAGPDPAAGYAFAETGARRVLRRYNALGHITGGTLVDLPQHPAEAAAAVERALREAFAEPDVALVHVRAVEYGCFLYAVGRP
ncbi:DUF1203 domain-containing protein [Streptomyces sp. NPDC041068]|uniref:DUF1203 domain-containing protein n=1 Tax=Streptomyces sp. NPDC041068 TaxID=3155130 RepID=UPI0033F7FCAF